MPNIVHYRNKCIGCGICYEMMPEVWRMSKKDGKATLIKGLLKKQTTVLPINPSLNETAKKVAKPCPVNIIKINTF